MLQGTTAVELERPQRVLEWRGLALASGTAQALLVLAAGAVLGDLEALLFGAGLAAASWLGWRRSRWGWALLAILSAVALFFMATATLSHLRAGEHVSVLALPAALSALAATSLLSALRMLIPSGRSGPQPGRVAMAGGGAFVVVMWLGLLLADPTAGSDGVDLVLAASDLAYSTDHLQADAGQVTLQMENEDLFWHTFTIAELGVDLAVPVSGRRTISFEAAPGTYRFFCRIPGHPEAGMVGSLEVVP